MQCFRQGSDLDQTSEIVQKLHPCPELLILWENCATMEINVQLKNLNFDSICDSFLFVSPQFNSTKNSIQIFRQNSIQKIIHNHFLWQIQFKIQIKTLNWLYSIQRNIHPIRKRGYRSGLVWHRIYGKSHFQGLSNVARQIHFISRRVAEISSRAQLDLAQMITLGTV